uniref:Uncharacterized protein n=1 Tax=Opuntia streptacantha TaxID=393608 RepID=A0A7C9CIN8_OPUST
MAQTAAAVVLATGHRCRVGAAKPRSNSSSSDSKVGWQLLGNGGCFTVWLVARWPSSGGRSNESWLAARTPLEQQQLVEEGGEMRKKNSIWPLPFVSCINE